MLEFAHLDKFFMDKITFIPGESEHEYIDLHLHTDDSDGINNIEFMKEFLHGKEHLIAITDHNSIENAVKLSRDDEINNIPAIELGMKDGLELLVYFNTVEELEEFYDCYVLPNRHSYRMTKTNKDAFYYLDILRAYDVYISIPHINGYMQKNYLKNKKTYIKEIINRVDALETYNHSLSKKRNFRAKHIRKLWNKKATFGSDGHTNKDIYSFYKFEEDEITLHLKIKSVINSCKSIYQIGKKHLLYLRKKSR